MMAHPSSGDVIGLYQRHAAAFDAERGKALFERPWLDRFRAALVPNLPVLDLGCGSGEPMAGYLIEQGHDVVGVDSSPAFIDLCRRRFPEQRWVVEDMRTLALPERFGGLLAWHSFFHLTPEDQRAMFPLFARHAPPGAALMFTSGPEHGERIGAFQGDALYHASLAPAAYEALLGANGFDVLAYAPEDPACGGATIWLAQFKA
jgi:SAM-dependent methyltransferase